MSKKGGVPEAGVVVDYVQRALHNSGKQNKRQGEPDTPLVVEDSSTPNWDRFITIAGRNAVIPLVHKGVKSFPGDVPDSVRTDLREQYRANAKRNLVMSGALHEILQEFRSREIRAIPFKGPVLAEFAYGDLKDRHFSDLDILVSPSDADAACNALRDLEYEPTKDVYESRCIERVRASPVLREKFNEHEFRRSSDGTIVEVRWEFKPEVLPAMDTLWQRRREQTVAGKPLSALDPVDALSIQTVHAAKHACRRLAWIADVAMVAQRVDDWERFTSHVTERKLERWASVSLRLAELFFDITIPRTARTSLGIDTADSLARAARSRWLNQPIDTTTNFTEFQFRTRLRPPLDTVRKVFAMTFVPNAVDYQALSLPQRFHILYYAYRPLRVLNKFGSWARSTRG